MLLVTYTLGIELWFRVFVREHHDGSATVHALEAPHVFAYAGSPKAEVARMTKVLAEFVVSISRGYQGNFVFREDQELRRLDVDVKPRGKVEEEIPISVSLLVTRQPHIRKERYVITAPRFYGFHLMVMEEDEIEEKARHALLRSARGLTSQVYTAWAERKDYEYTPFSPENEPFALYLRGSNVHELLRG